MLVNVEMHHDDLPGDLVRRLQEGGVVACDIETSGLNWRSDVIGTCQFYSPTHGAFLVKVSPQSQIPRGIKTLMEDPWTKKIFHHAPFDLRFLRHVWGIRSQSVACTKVASKIVHPEKCSEDHSLQRLVREYLGISLNKDEQVSNWLSPTLTRDQLTYACNDVRYLVKLHTLLQEEIVEKGQQGLYYACCTFLPSQVELQISNREDIFSY